MPDSNLAQKKNFSSSPIKPILKWAGGKQQLLSEIIQRVPSSFNRYIEPFVGGGAVFFAIEANEYIISDTNPELINLYQTLSNGNFEDVIEKLESYKNEEDFYYKTREKEVEKLTNIERSARFIYLNRTCFNGLYRVNKKGEFNVPFGKYKNPRIIFPERLKKASEKLSKTKIYNLDYHEVLDTHSQKNDLIFLDPPYIPISENASFKRYTKDQFRLNDQRKLAQLVRKLAEKGCKIILTNSNHPLIYELYDGFNIEVIETKRNINRNGNKRTGEDTIVSINV
ncbi:MAG: DNA adenine methylase [Balneola sp.]